MEVVVINQNPHNQDKFPGNNSDFYSDDMSRKAVGKLFDEPHAGNNENNGRSGYANMDDNNEHNNQPRRQDQFSPRPQNARNSSGYPDFNANKQTGKPGFIEPISYEGLDLDDRSRKRPAGHSQESVRARRPDLPHSTNPRAPQGLSQATTRMATVNRGREAGGPSRPVPERNRYTANENKFVDADMMDDNTQKIIKYVFAGVLFVLVVILFLLLLRINGLQRQIAELTENFETITSELESATALAIRMEGFENDVGNIRTQISEMVSPPFVPNEPVTSVNNGQASNDTPAQQDQPAAGTGGGAATGAQTHIVQSGDTLSSVAQRFYGASNPTLWALIREANGMTSDALRVGQTITIPPQQ